MTFIEKLANLIKDKNYPLQRLTIVLPSERAKKYLRRALFKAYQKPIISPEIITMDKWIKQYSPYTVLDKTRVLLELYEIHKKKDEEREEEHLGFDDFLTWGEILLNDFNDVDKYLIDAKDIFKNLQDVKEIEAWSFNSEELTKNQQKFLDFWNRIEEYYTLLNTKLRRENYCYPGKAYRFLAENIDVFFKKNREQRFLFAGFNALSSSEMKIIKQLHQMGRADVIIDADKLYLEDEQHEAGMFLRKTLKEIGSVPFIIDELSHKNLNVEIIESTQKTGQIKVASTILNDLSEKEIQETLLLLGDESLISPLIKNLPKRIKKANITMGLPLKATPVKTWVELLFSVQENKRRFGEGKLYFKDVQTFIKHPFVIGILPDKEYEQLLREEETMIQKNFIFIFKEKLKIGDKTRELLDLITEPWDVEAYKNVIPVIRKTNCFLFEFLQENHEMEKAIIESFDQSLIDFGNLIQDIGLPKMHLKTFRSLFNRHWYSKSIAYHGTPIDGLQIMGLLETRLLDFKKIIVLGMNEGSLPPTNPMQTMIPMDLRSFYGLPVSREKQGLFAHHFYRLLHSCEKITMTYTTVADGNIGNIEPSRYLQQIDLELQRINPNVKIKKSIYTIHREGEGLIKKEVKKTDEILSKIDQIIEKSTSPSMLATFFRCPLDFYYKYVLGLREDKDVEESLEANTFGTFVHQSLETLYSSYSRHDKGGKEIKGVKNITINEINKMLIQYSDVVKETFLTFFNGEEKAFKTGENYLAYEMALKIVKDFLKEEKRQIEFKKDFFIEFLEKEYTSDIEVEVFGEKKKVRLRGNIDRIDSEGENVRLIDYKTGKVELKNVKIATGSTKKYPELKKEEVINSMKKRKHVLQLMQYAFLYYKKHGVIPDQVGIISFVSGNFELFPLQLDKDYSGVTLEDVIKEYPYYLGKLLEDIYDKEKPFKHTETKKELNFCKYC